MKDCYADKADLSFVAQLVVSLLQTLALRLYVPHACGPEILRFYSKIFKCILTAE